MRPAVYLLVCLTAVLTGCTNYLYEGRLSAKDAHGKERDFALYWTKTDPLFGRDKAGPAVLLTECSTTRIDFADQPQGIVFRGEPGRDRPVGGGNEAGPVQVCGRILGYAKLADVPAGQVKMKINCTPLSSEFAVQPRDYLKARKKPYVFPIVEKTKRWSLFGETLPAPVLSCPKPATH